MCCGWYVCYSGSLTDQTVTGDLTNYFDYFSCQASGAEELPYCIEEGHLSDDEGEGGEEKDKKKKKLKKKKSKVMDEPAFTLTSTLWLLQFYFILVNTFHAYTTIKCTVANVSTNVPAITQVTTNTYHVFITWLDNVALVLPDCNLPGQTLIDTEESGNNVTSKSHVDCVFKQDSGSSSDSEDDKKEKKKKKKKVFRAVNTACVLMT